VSLSDLVIPENPDVAMLMAKGLNKVMLIGRLGKDAELKFTPAGLAVANFSMATTEEWFDKAANEKKERTEWHRILCFGKLAEICGKYLAKGSQVYVEGKLQTRSWEQDGITKYITEINIHDMQMLDSKPGGSQPDQGQQQQYRPAAQQPAPQQRTIDGGFSDDIPF